jgi:hypothetical protein
MAATRVLTGRRLVFLLAVCVVGSAKPQTILQTIPQSDASRLRPASPEEGEAIVRAVWELRHGLLPKPDCSHFVHAVYAQAGFDYEYAQSAAIFAGIDSFRRVKIPQPGDLVVWHGHVGIVIDPVEHSFYSSVLKGFAIEDYRSNYWTSRGSPRFYRYLVDDAHGTSLLARTVQPLPTADVAQAPVEFVPDPPREAPSANLPAVTNPLSEPRSRVAETADSETETRDVVFVSLKEKPSKREVLAAILRSVDAKAELLAQSLRLESEPLVIVANRFNVTGLIIKDKSGWAKVEVRERASLHFGTADPTPLTYRWQIMLRRQEQGWVMFVPQAPIFLRQKVAKMVLGRRLASLTYAPVSFRERKKVERILDELSSEKDVGDRAP